MRLAAFAVLAIAATSASAGAAPQTELREERSAGRDSSPAEGAWEVFSRLVLGFSDLGGEIRVGRLTYWGFPPVTDLRCRVRIADDGWRFENVSGSFCGGVMTAESAIGFRPEGRELRLVAEFADARLEEFTRHVKYEVTPGRLNARLDLRVTSQGRAGLDGSAEIHVRGADLGRIPLAFNFLTLTGLQKEVLEEADALMTLTPRAIRFQSLELRSRSGVVSFEADRLGSVTYDGGLDLRFKPKIESRLVKNVPFVGPTADEVWSKIEQGLMRVHLTGTAAEPKFQWRPFRQ